MKKVISTALLIIVILLSGCAAPSRYSWNNYDGVLYQHYKNPAENDAFIENLKGIVQAAEASGNVPPGIYAEYGFALYEKGQYNEAMIFYQKEYDKWPESRVLMKKMMSNTKMRIEKTGQKQSEGNPVKQ
jgi:hypothetical protein